MGLDGIVVCLARVRACVLLRLQVQRQGGWSALHHRHVGKSSTVTQGPPVSASKERNGGIFTFKAVLKRAQKAAQRGKEAAGTQNWQAGISVAGSLETYRPHNAGANIVMQP